MKHKRRFIYLGGILILVFGLGFSTLGNKDLELVKNLDIYYTLFRELNMFYVDETDPEELVTTSIEAMLSSLDPYTTFIPESDMDDFQFQTTGEYGGIGSLIRRVDNAVMIAEPYAGFPAEKAGMRAGDKILKVDGVSTSDMAIESVSDKLKGKPGTELVLTVERYGEAKPLIFTLVREKVSIRNVPYYGMIDQETGYIRISNFTHGAGKEVEQALLSLKKDNDLASLVLDLRANPGGLLIEAVRICNLFVDKGEKIVSTRGKMEQWDSDYTTTVNPVDTEIPLVVLVNRGSASASEIVAGALQDLDRAVVIGQRTFGKGLVQTSRPLKYNAQLKVTTAKYYIPSGRCIQALDYSHRNEDGSVGYIPDSLVSEYKTLNGRIVKDGGGISPDHEAVAERLSQFSSELYVRSLIFDFATDFYWNNPEIDRPGEYSLSEDTYRDFAAFLEKRGFDYTSASQEALERLTAVAKNEKHYKANEELFEELGKSLDHDLQAELELYRDEVTRLLEDEIIGRYYYEDGLLEHSLGSDKQVKKALGVIKNDELYTSTLRGTEGLLSKNNQ